MNEKQLSVECDASREVVELHLNRPGLDYLIDVLIHLRDAQVLGRGGASAVEAEADAGAVVE